MGLVVERQRFLAATAANEMMRLHLHCAALCGLKVSIQRIRPRRPERRSAARRACLPNTGTYGIAGRSPIVEIPARP